MEKQIKFYNELVFLMIFTFLLLGCEPTEETGILPKSYRNIKAPDLTPISGETNQYGYPELPEPASIRNLVKQNNIDEIDSLCKYYDIKSRTDYRYEYHVRSILLSILQDPLAIVFIGKWGNALPNSPYQKMAMSRYHIEKAWDARGNRFINEVPEESIEQFKTFLRSAISYLDEIYEIDPLVLYQWNLRFMVLRHLGNDESLLLCVNESLEINPYQALIRIQFQNNIQPRWGGTHELMISFIEECEHLVKYNPKLIALKAIYFDDIAFYQKMEKRYSAAINTYSEAIKIAPYEANLLRGIGRLYYNKKEYETALDYYKSAVKYGGSEAKDLTMCGQITSMLTQGKSEEEAQSYLYQTKEFVEKALLNDPSNRQAKKLKKWYGRHI